MERWLPVVGFEGSYEVSDLGRVRSLPRTRRSGYGSTARVNGRIMRAHPVHGYPQVTLSLGDSEHSCKVHRMVMEAFVGPCPEGLEVRHLDGTRDNNALGNLTYGTRVENHQDTIRHGRTARGERNVNCKMTVEIVQWIRKQPVRRGYISALAVELGVSASSVSSVVRGRTWAWVQ